jgi:hypothetical protein
LRPCAPHDVIHLKITSGGLKLCTNVIRSAVDIIRGSLAVQNNFKK